MYKVLLNNTVFYDARVDDLALINAVLNREENAAGTFEFIVAPAHPRYEELESRALVTVLRDDAILWQGVIVEIQTSLYKEKTVHCDGELVYLNESILRPKHYQGTTLQVFTEFVNLHNAQVEPAKRFTLGMVTVTGRAINCYSNMESTMQCIKDHCIDTHGGVIRIRYADDKKYIDYLNAEDFRTSNQPIKLGLNIKDYSSNLDNTDICSGVIPLGAKDEQTTLEGVETRLTIASVNGGKDYLVKDSSIEKYGYIYKVLEYDDITDPSALKTRGEEFLNITQYENVVINVSAVDLALVDDGVNAFDLSDQIRVISEPHGLNKIFSLTAQTLNLLAPQNDVFTLGKEEKKSISAKTANVSDEIKREIYNAVTPNANILDMAQNNASALINGNGKNGYVVFHTNSNGEPYEILIMNTKSIDTATKVWRWNSNGLGYAKRNSASDPLNFGLAMTIDGAIVADYITAGALQGVEIIGERGKIAGLNMLSNMLYIGSNNPNDTLAGLVLATYGLLCKGYDSQGVFHKTILQNGFVSTDKLWSENIQIGKYAETNPNAYIGYLDKNGIDITKGDNGTFKAIYSAYHSPNNNRFEEVIRNPSNFDSLKYEYLNYNDVSNIGYPKGVSVQYGNFPNGNYITLNSSVGAIQTNSGNYNVQIGNTTGYQVVTNGRMKAVSFDTTSDKRLKKNIKTLSQDIADKIYRLRPVEYILKDSPETDVQMGFIAQEVEELGFDGVVHKEEYYSMNYNALIAPLVLTIQKQHEEIEELKKQIAEIKEALNG